MIPIGLSQDEINAIWKVLVKQLRDIMMIYILKIIFNFIHKGLSCDIFVKPWLV